LHRNDFERGSTDVFEFNAPSTGKPMSKIRIGHDGAGIGAGWHLAKVVVENLRTGECAIFEANRKVAPSFGACTGRVEARGDKMWPVHR
jgi:hypothetical protein